MIEEPLPAGTVTFLFSDIEGSTKLLQRLGDDYATLIDDHARIFRSAIEDLGGREVGTEGDSFFVVFPNAGGAAEAAAQIQRSLAEHSFLEPVRVRMGLHTGEGRLGGDNYIGIDVHRAAHIAAAGHGGQVLLSDATRALVEHSLPDGVGLLDLGEHRLKDLAHPERLFQLVIAGLVADFPPPRTLDARPNNLPVQLTSFIGRERELADVKGRLVDSTRLLTLTGPGGTGKTRLALQAAAETVTDFDHGAFFVDLAPVADPGLVPSAIAQAIGVGENPPKPLIETVQEEVEGKELLLVIDNFEQVVESADLIPGLLSAAPKLKVLVTSRVALHLYGEQEYSVPPLSLPDPTDLPGLDTLSHFEAVRLFIERATALKPEFRVTDQNALAVAEICARLDGLPLAIELAAAGIKLLPPQQILQRLGQVLALSSRAHDLPPRQRTLRGAIQWSYDLLDEAERTLFVHLSVFAGGAAIDAIDSVCAATKAMGLDTLDGLASLVDKSLLRQMEVAGEARFTMLETIREYALERLEESGEADGIRESHAAYFAAVAQQAESHFTSEDQAEWLDRFQLEADNVRASLRWHIDHGQAESGLLTGAALWRFWQQRGYLSEGRRWLEELLAMPEAARPTRGRVKALGALGSLAYWTGDPEVMAPAYREAADLAREVGDDPLLSEALYNRGFIPFMQEDYGSARRDMQESADIAGRSGDRNLEANALSMLAYFDLLDGKYEDAIETLMSLLETWRELGAGFQLAEAFAGVAQAHRLMGNYDEAAPYYRQALEKFREVENPTGVAMVLDQLAANASGQEDFERAVRLAGAASVIKEEIGGGAPEETIRVGNVRDDAAASLSAEEIERLWQEGRAMGADQAVADALQDGPA